MPRSCCALGVAEGDTREIAILSRVGKPTCFVITELDESTAPPTVWLSRTIAQQRAQDHLLASLRPGDVIPARVTHLEPFGAFVDIGVHQDGLVHISQICSRYIKHPSEAVTVGDIVDVVVLSADPKSHRIALSMKQAK